MNLLGRTILRTPTGLDSMSHTIASRTIAVEAEEEMFHGIVGIADTMIDDTMMIVALTNASGRRTTATMKGIADGDMISSESTLHAGVSVFHHNL